ncbi:hypothetical protein HF313_17585 [Massilia atriviolacea]|nr:PEP/pyruvate-binding domain-containing protein [Massilia atriviolacea]
MQSSCAIVSSLDASTAADAGQLGGKGKNLLALRRAGFNVPFFVVLPVAFFEELMGAELPLLDRLCACAAAAAGAERKALLAQARDLVLARHLGKDERAAILRLLAGQGDYFAVRSSAIDEDGAGSSFAGQLDSFLFVRTDDSLFHTIVDCFASAYNERSFAYRCESGLATSRIRPAVVVQAMVFAEVSGLIFTGNPMTCNPDEAVISATYGAGEGVVSGEMDCDTWYLDEAGALARRQLADKSTGLFFDDSAGAGLRHETVDAARASAACLDERQIAQIAQAGRRIETLYGGTPQDIEWAIIGSDLYILQTRPVTNLSHISKSRPRTILDNSNIVESFSGVTSPLTFSFASRVYEKVYEQFYGLFGVPADEIRRLKPVFRNMLAYYDGHVYYNLNSWYRSLSLLPFFDTNKNNFDASIGVQANASADTVRQGRGHSRIGAALFTLSASARIGWFYLRRHALCRRFARDFDSFMDPYMKLDFAAMDNTALLATYDRVEDRMLNNWRAPIINDFFAETFHGVLRHVLVKHIARDEQEVSRLHNDLLCGQGGMASVAPTRLLLEIAAWIENAPDLRADMRALDVQALRLRIEQAATPGYALLKERVDAYRSDFGFRCINELKLEETSIKDDPSFVIQALKNYVLQGVDGRRSMDGDKQQTARAAERIVAERCGKNWLLRAATGWLIRNSRQCVMEREELRFYRTKIFGFLRYITNAMGANFARQGQLEKAQDIYALTLDEAFGLIERRAVSHDTVREIVGVRLREQAAFARAAELPPRLQFYGELIPENMVAVSSSDAAADGTIDDIAGLFKGTPCSSGTVQGRVKVVHDTTEVQLNGEILVTRRTDPGWVPFFPCISGLIVERGSVLSHSAVVAREMGIPAVVGLRGITTLLKDGDSVRLDGAAGMVCRA